MVHLTISSALDFAGLKICYQYDLIYGEMFVKRSTESLISFNKLSLQLNNTNICVEMWSEVGKFSSQHGLR